MTQSGTCDAYDYYRPEGHQGTNLLAICDQPDSHGNDHTDSRTGHAWTGNRWSRYAESANGRYVVHVYERTGPMYEPWEIDPDHHEADPETIAQYEAERARMMAKFGAPLTRFAIGTRFYVGGSGWDALVGHDAPTNDNDDVAWGFYYAHELNALALAVGATAHTLKGRGVDLPSQIGDYLRSRHAGCIGCPCSPGLVCKDAVKGPNGRTVDVSVDVRSDEEIAQAAVR